MPPVTGTEALGTPLLKNGQKNKTSISAIPPVAPKATQKLSDDKMDLNDYFRKVEPAGKASPKISEDKKNLYDYFKKVKPAVKLFEPSDDVRQSLGVKKGEVKEIKCKASDPNQDCKMSKSTRKRKRKELKCDTVYDQNKNTTNVLVSLENSSDKLSENGEEGKGLMQLMASDVDDFEDEIEMLCYGKEVGRNGIKSGSDEKKSKHHKKSKNRGFLLKKKDVLSLEKKENSVIKKNVEKQMILDKAKKEKVCFVTEGTAKTLVSGKGENTSIVKEEHRDTFSNMGNENSIITQERAQNHDLSCQEKNGKAPTVRQIDKSESESGGENDPKSLTCKEIGSPNKTNAFAFMMATRHKQDEAIQLMKLEDAGLSGDDDLEILEHKKTVESLRPSISSALERKGKKEFKKGANAFALLMTNKQTSKKEEEVAQITEITISDSDSEGKALRMSSKKQGDNKSLKRKAEEMNDSLYEFEIGVEKRKKKAFKRAKKSVGGKTGTCISKGTLKSNTKPETTDAIRESKIQTPPNTKPETTEPVGDKQVQIPVMDVECMNIQGHENSPEICGLTGDLRSVKVISFQDYMAACKELLILQSDRETSDVEGLSGKSEISKQSESFVEDQYHCKSQDVSYQNTNSKVHQSETGDSIKANTGPPEKVKTYLSEKAKTAHSSKAKIDLSKQAKTDHSKKSMTGLSKKVMTDPSDRAKTGPSEEAKADLSEMAKACPADTCFAEKGKKAKTSLAEINKTGLAKTDDTDSSENAMANDSEALSTNSEEVESEMLENTVTSQPERMGSDPSEKTESYQEKTSNPKTKSISSFFKKLTKEESLQERSKITIVADVHATAEGSSTSTSMLMPQAKDIKAKKPCTQNASPSDTTVSDGEVKAEKNKVEKVTPRRNARRKTRFAQEELEKIELLEQVTITEGDASSQEKKSHLLAPSANSSSIALSTDQSGGTLNVSKAKEANISFKGKAWGGSAYISVENGTQEGNSLIINKSQDDAELNNTEEATSEKMTSFQGTLKEQTVEKVAPEIFKQVPVRKAKQMGRDEPGSRSRKKPECTPKESEQALKKEFGGKTIVDALTNISEGKEPKLGKGRRSKKQKKSYDFEIPTERASEKPREPEEVSGCEDLKSQEDSCSASSWEDDGNEDKENIVKYESTLLEKPGNRISLRLRRLPQASYADKRKKVLSQIQGTALSNSHSKVKAKAILSKAKSRKADLKSAGRKKKVSVNKRSTTEVVGMMEVDLTGSESEDSDVFLEKKGKIIKKSQFSGKKNLNFLQKKPKPKPKKGKLVGKGKTGLKPKEGNSKKAKSKASKTDKQEKREAVKIRPERKAAVNARQFLEENKKIVEVEEKVIKRRKNKECKGQSQTGTTKLAPIFTKKDSEKAVEILKVLSPTKVKARQEFLMSGLPTEIKLQIATEKSLEVNYGPQFPKISHVQQKNDGCEMWSLPAPQIKPLIESSNTSSVAVPQNGSIFENRIEIVERSHSLDQRPGKLCVNGLSRILRDIKERHPGVPVYSLFKSYLERKKERLFQYKKEVEREKQQKCQNDVVVIDLEEEETLTGRKGKKKRRSGAHNKRTKATGKTQGRLSLDAKWQKEEEEIKSAEEEGDPWNERTPHMWTSLFAPRNGQEVIGNKDIVRRVRVWLLEWKRKCEVEARREIKKGKKKSKKDKDDFLTSDESNGFSDQETEDNTLLLTGPSGVGKSALVYAIAKEIGYKVLEVNASSKRNGKHVISRLAEATQSHRVSNSQASSSTQTNTLVTMFASKADGGETGKFSKGILEVLSEDSSQESGQEVDKKKAMSLVLFEDIDIVFEDADEGFLSAVQSFMATTKRPIILTTNQPTTQVLSKIKGEYEHLQLQTPDVPVIALHAQLACLAEGVCANARDLLCLVNLNCGDIRQTLLDLQFWSQSSQASKSYKEMDNKTKLKVDDLPQPTILHEEVPDLTLKDLFPKIPSRKIKVVEYQQGCTVAKTGRHLMFSSLTPSLISLLPLNPEIVYTSLPLISHLPLMIVEEKKKKYPLDSNNPCVKMTRLYEKHSWLSIDDEEEDEVSRAEEETDKEKEEAEREPPPPEKIKVSVHKCMDTFSKLYDSLAFHDLLDAQTPSSREPDLNSWWWSSTVTAGLSSLPSSVTYNGTMQDTVAELEEVMTGQSVMLWNQELKKAVEGIEGEWKQLQLPWSKSNSVAALMTGKADDSRVRRSSILQRSMCDKIPVVSRWNHRSFSLEYLPSIRTITRMDELAAVVCEKRRARRFLSHLSQQSIHLNPEDRTTLANVMQF